MGYDRDENRYGRGYGGEDRWPGREEESSSRLDRGGRNWGGERSRGGNDQGFAQRAGQEVRSWFSDDNENRSQGAAGREHSDYHGQSYGSEDRSRSYGEDQGRQNRGQQQQQGGGIFGGGGGGEDRGRYDEGGYGGGVPATELWSGSGFGGGPDHGRRFDRIDAGSTGTHGAHPMSAPVGGGMDTSYGSSARYRAILAQNRGSTGSGDYDERSPKASGVYGNSGDAARHVGYGQEQSSGQQQSYGQGQNQSTGQTGGRPHDPHYSQWRNRQIEELDRDYEDYCRENESRFQQEFGGWREKRQGQRQSLGRVTEHMEVIGSDGQHVGTVDKVHGERIILTKSDPNAGGIHHSIPLSWVEKVEEKVIVNKTAEQAMHAWQDEDRNRALFEKPDSGSEGPHVLDRSFSGTYSDRKE